MKPSSVRMSAGDQQAIEALRRLGVPKLEALDGDGASVTSFQYSEIRKVFHVSAPGDGSYYVWVEIDDGRVAEIFTTNTEPRGVTARLAGPGRKTEFLREMKENLATLS